MLAWLTMNRNPFPEIHEKPAVWSKAVGYLQRQNSYGIKTESSSCCVQMLCSFSEKNILKVSSHKYVPNWVLGEKIWSGKSAVVVIQVPQWSAFWWHCTFHQKRPKYRIGKVEHTDNDILLNYNLQIINTCTTCYCSNTNFCFFTLEQEHNLLTKRKKYFGLLRVTINHLILNTANQSLALHNNTILQSLREKG